MSTIEFDLLCAIETHDADAMRRLLDEGVDARVPIRGKSLATHLTEMYSRSDRFPDCLHVLLEHGGQLDDPALLPVLLDDADGVTRAVREDPSLLAHRTSMVCAFTPLVEATLLHVAAEFGHLRAARALLDLGADVDARAAVDAEGLNGHTPLFHTVNSNRNRSAPLMHLLLAAGARSDVRLAGITWGAGMEWETTLFDVTPVSYAQFGLLPQVHRDERDIRDNVKALLTAAGRPVPLLANVPNRYLQSSLEA
jgi:ankyrin repeat protein